MKYIVEMIEYNLEFMIDIYIFYKKLYQIKK